MSVSRLLRDLTREGVLWQRENGRYYLSASRRLFERRKIYSCLMRAPAMWLGLHQAILTGVARVCPDEPLSLTFLQEGTGGAIFATGDRPSSEVETQREALHAYFRDGTHRGEGILLDGSWLDDALAAFPHRLTNAVVLGRETTVAALSSVAMDTSAAALLGLAHLFARGFETIWVITPNRMSCATHQLAAAIKEASEILGRHRDGPIVLALDECLSGSRLERQLTDPRRLGLLCLDESTSIGVYDSFREKGIEMPGRAGVLAVQGTEATAGRRISALTVDYIEMGMTAGTLLRTAERRTIRLVPELAIRGTT